MWFRILAVLILEGKMVRRDFYLEVSAGKVSLWCFVIETSYKSIVNPTCLSPHPPQN